MEQHYIDSNSHPLYKTFLELYSTSFPIFEQRTAEQQEEAFRNERYRLLTFNDDNVFTGFISYWEFDTYIYIEHFAINTAMRGKGYGSKVLDMFIKSTDKTVVLEIDPVIDSISEARLRFYKRCGFHENPYPHRHPAYREGYGPHPLTILTTGGEISEKEYREFQADLSAIVMNGEAAIRYDVP